MPPQVIEGPPVCNVPPRVRVFTVRVRPAPTLAVAELAGGAILRLLVTEVPVAIDFTPLPENIRL